MLRIVAAIDFLAPGSGGAGVAIDKLFDRIAKSELVHEVKIICYKSKGLEKDLARLSSNPIYELWNGIPFPFWDNSDGFVLLKYKTIRKRLDKICPNIIVLGASTILTLQISRYAFYNNIPFIFISHTQPEILFLYLKKVLGKTIASGIVSYIQRKIYSIYANASLFVFPTEVSLNYLSPRALSKIDQSKIIILSNGVDLETFRYHTESTKLQRLIEGQIKLLFVGRLMIDKMPDIPIRALKIIKQKYPNTVLTIVGIGPRSKELKKLVINESLSDAVHFTDHISETDLVNYYHQSHFTIVPSYTEMQSLVTLESIACGTPVIASDAFYNAAKSIVIDNECGSVYNYQSPKALAEVIINLADNKTVYENFTTNCLKTRERYSYKIICEKWLEHMIKLTGQ